MKKKSVEIICSAEKLIKRTTTNQSWVKYYIKIMLFDVMNFYLKLPYPYKKYRLYIFVKRYLYYIKKIFFNKLV